MKPKEVSVSLKKLKVEWWKMSVFKKQSRPSAAAYRRSLSEQESGTTKVAASLKDYQWHYQVKSKRTQAISDLGKSVGAYRWQMHPTFHCKGSKRVLSHSLNREHNQLSPIECPLSMDSSGVDDLQEDPARKMIRAGSKPFRVPFNRSMSEPAPHWRNRSVKPFLQPVRSVDCEHQGYFIRGIFSTLSSGFSKMLTQKGEPSTESVNEWGTDSNRIDLNTGNSELFCSSCSWLAVEHSYLLFGEIFSYFKLLVTS